MNIKDKLIQELLQAYNAMINLANAVQKDKDLVKYFKELQSVIDYSNIKINNCLIAIKKEESVL